MKPTTEELNAAIQMIEKKTVYRCQTRCDDGSCMINSTNGMPTENWSAKKIMRVALIIMHKPEGM